MLAALQKANDVAVKYGDNDTQAKVKKILPQIYNRMATEAFKANDFTAALANFDKVLELDPNNIQALNSKGVVYRKQNNADLNKETMLKIIELGTKLSDTKSVDAAKGILAADYLKAANAAYVKSDFKGALPALEEAIKYDPKNANAYYILAFSQNKLKEYDSALDAITKGLPLETQTPEALARFYYEQGVAYKAKGDKDKALESFKSASFGKFLLPAKAHIKDLTKPAVPAKK